MLPALSLFVMRVGYKFITEKQTDKYLFNSELAFNKHVNILSTSLPYLHNSYLVIYARFRDRDWPMSPSKLIRQYQDSI